MNNQNWDAIIIGGGIHGASLAYHLSILGLKPLILEKQFIASGATGRSSGLVRMHYDLELESRLAWISYGYFKHSVGEQLGIIGVLTDPIRNLFCQLAAAALALSNVSL